MHTEKYSPKSSVVNFDTQMSSSRSEEWTMVSHVKKMIRPIRIANDVSSHVRKMIRPIRSNRGVLWVSRQNSRLFSEFAERRFAHIRGEKFFSNSFFSLKKVKNISEMEWNSFVCFTVDKENCGEPAKQQRKGKNRTRRKLMLCFLSELLCLPFISLSLYWNRPFYLNSLIFNCKFRTNS